MQGERDFPERVRPFIFRPGLEIDARLWQVPDVTVVEISSVKRYHIDGEAVQSNYLTRHFEDFFASFARASRFWSLARDKTADALRAFLAAEPVFATYSADDQALQASVRLSVQTFDEMYADMAQIVERVGRDRLIFVTHVNAANVEGEVIPSRDKAINWVATCAERLGVPCFDPTALMREFGQARAMEREGLDLTHFTDAFSDHWYRHFHFQYVLPRIAGHGDQGATDDAASGAKLVDAIVTVIENGDFFEGSRRVFAALRTSPDHPGLRQLRAAVNSRIGNHAGVLADLAGEPFDTLPVTAQMILMRAHFEEGGYAEALAVAAKLLSDEVESSGIYQIATRSAMHLGRAAEAAGYAKLAFRIEPQFEMAGIVADVYLADGKIAQLSRWFSEVLERAEKADDLAIVRSMAGWALTNRQATLFAAAFDMIAAKDFGSVDFLIEAAREQGILLASAQVLARTVSRADVPERLIRRIATVAGQWSAEAESALARGENDQAFALARAALGINPAEQRALRVEDLIIDAIGERVRDAYRQRDTAAILALCDGVAEQVTRRRQPGAIYALALVDAGRMDDAMRVATAMLAAAPDDGNARIVHARVAAAAGDFLTAFDAYAALAQSDAPDLDRHRARIDAFMASAWRLGTRRIRELVVRGDFATAVDILLRLEQSGLADAGDAERGRERLHIWRSAMRRVREASAQGEFAAAVDILTLVERSGLGDLEDVEREKSRLQSAMRVRLKALEAEGEGLEVEAPAILRLMASISPRDPAILRRVALESMKIHNYQEAAHYWVELDRVSPGVESVKRNLSHCQKITGKLRETAAKREAILV